MTWKETKEEIKKTWLIFIFFGLIIIIINTGVQVSLTNYINSKWEGPPCRIDLPVDEFVVEQNKYFGLDYLLINLRNKDLLIEKVDAYCFWKSQEQVKLEKGIIFMPPSIEEVSEPKELESVPSSKSVVRRASCKSPEESGKYKLRIIAKTTLGECIGEGVMNVK